MPFNRSVLAVGLVLATWFPANGDDRASHVQLGLRVPAGFEVTEFADSRLANDIFSMTVDPHGRIVVAGPGYIRILVDDDGKGKANRAIDFADGPKEGAQGLLWEGSSLYFTGDGGLRRYRDENGAGRADRPSELIRALKTGGEHEAHDIRRGPDGWLYVLCGNSTGIRERHATLPTSPIQKPIAGCVLRFSPDLRSSEIVADGFRNPYRMDFSADGELLTFDSDNERCVSLPWYESTRFYHVLPGGHYGWQAPQRAATWRMPPYFCDVIAPLAYFGRGSPTGVACYRQTQFPDAYRGGVFLLDWTFGKVYFAALARSRSSYKVTSQLFLESVGDNGFAPTDALVHPATGDLYISIGGRGTRGAVYRIRYLAGLKGQITPAVLPIRRRSLDWRPGLDKELMEQTRSGDDLMRRHAIEGIFRHRDHFGPDQLLHTIRANWGHSDRHVRRATASLIASLAPAVREKLWQEPKLSSQESEALYLGSYRAEPAKVCERASHVIAANKNAAPELILDAVRLIQLALGDIGAPLAKGSVWEGYSLRRPLGDRDLTSRVQRDLRSAFPFGHPDVDRELSRTLAMLEDEEPATLAKAIDKIDAASDPVSDIHYLIVLARLRAPRSLSVTRRVADVLLRLDQKLGERHLNRDRNWPLRIGELHAELARKDATLNDALLASPDFGRPDHALLAGCAGFNRERAAEIFLAKAKRDENYPWSAPLIELVGGLSEERSRKVLRRLWGKIGLDEVILRVLARNPEASDREKFLEGLNSPQLATVRLCLDALKALPRPAGGMEVLALVRVLRGLPDGREENVLREQVAKYLGQMTGLEKLGADQRAWASWFAEKYPELAARAAAADGVDVAGWNKRLADIDWSGGDAERGRAVFTKTSCASCHAGSQALGPDLHGITSRFSRADLFTAILQPSKDVSPRYRTLLVSTSDGKVYQGLVIYEAVDSLLLQTGAATTVRIAVDQIVSRRFTATSLMPAGLLDKLNDAEIADLYAHLRSLGKSSTAEKGS